MNREKRLERLTEYFTPTPTLEQLADRAILALERDPNVLEVDGVPIWQIQERLNKEIRRLKEEDSEAS
jgi:hypothetical protein